MVANIHERASLAIPVECRTQRRPGLAALSKAGEVVLHHLRYSDVLYAEKRASSRRTIVVEGVLDVLPVQGWRDTKLVRKGLVVIRSIEVISVADEDEIGDGQRGACDGAGVPV